MGEIPELFISYIFRARIEAVKKLSRKELDNARIFLEFTRTSPVVVTNGPEGLSGSVKMVGFIPKKQYLHKLIEKARDVVERKKELGMSGVIDVLLREFYVEDIIDFSVLGGLEMGFKHSWQNIKATGKATLVFYTPPRTSFEVRCDVEIHEDGPIWEYMNLLHDVFHAGASEGSKYPTYVFRIREIYDNSASRGGFGKLIFKLD